METQEQKHAEFQQIIKPVIDWLNDNFHPHTKIIIDCNSGEIVEGVMIVNEIDNN